MNQDQTEKKSVAKLYGLVIVNGPKLFNNGGNKVVQIKACDHYPTAGDKYPPTLTLVYKGGWYKEMCMKFKKWDKINVLAEVECYDGKIYGKRGKPIHYPNGNVRRCPKIRFKILMIKHFPEEV